MIHLLDRFPVRYFWRFPVLNLKTLLSYLRIDARKSGSSDLEHANELTRLLSQVRSRDSDRNSPLRAFRAASCQQLYPMPLEPESHFRIWSFAPSSRQCEHYESALARCFSPDNRLAGNLEYGDHNQVSVGLLVEFGKTTVVLGGDVEGPAWEDACDEFRHSRFDAVAVKVSHHGSTNGYIDGLWGFFAAGSKPLAIITPFRRHGLPKLEALEHIRDFASPIFTTCRPAISAEQMPVPLNPQAPPRSRQALHEQMGAIAEPGVTQCGRCSFTFNDAGQCLVQELSPPAEALSL
jgi:hypothetical protein